MPTPISKRLVLDTSVLVAAFRSPNGASRRMLKLIAQERLRPLATPALFLEYEDVLTRPEQLEAHGVSQEEIQEFLGGLVARLEPVEIHFQWRPQLTDPDDELVLEAALNGRADALVTHNTRHFLLAANRFGLRILTPANLFRKELS